MAAPAAAASIPANEPASAAPQVPAVQLASYGQPANANSAPGTVSYASAPGLQQLQREEIAPPAEDVAGRKVPQLLERLKIPDVLPGANAPPILLPPSDYEHPEQRLSVIEQLFPSPKDVRPIPLPSSSGPGGQMTLEQLEDMAAAHNPILVQAEADVTSARGAAVQAGVHPNPVVGYEADTVGSTFTRNYQGVFAMQTVKTAGKLGLARAAANMGLVNAEIQLRQTRIDVLSQVRTNYYAVLVAQEGLLINTGLEHFTAEAYRIQVDKLCAGEGTGYEPAQLRTLAVQARAAVVQSQNRFISAWKQLSASVGIPELPPAALEGAPTCRCRCSTIT